MTKITPEHLARNAIVYIRQSSPHQVANNLESQRRQYALVARGQAPTLRSDQPCHDPHVEADTPAQTENREWARGNKPARKNRKKSGRQPHEVDGSRRQIGLDFHVGEAAPDGAGKPMPRLGFAMKAL